MIDEKFWLAIAFLTFVGLVVKKVAPIIAKNLDLKSKEIAEELLAAKELKGQAARILAEAEKRYSEAVSFGASIIQDSANEAQKYLEEARKNAEAEIAKKMVAVQNRIKHEEEQAVREIKIKIINSAMQMVQNSLQNVQKSQSNALIKRAADDVSKLVH